MAYYRVGFEEIGRPLLSPKHPHASFWRQANSNFLDLCVLEWCKLFGDKKGEHYWKQMVSDQDDFYAALLTHLCDRASEFPTMIKAMRHYRDKFVAHLDTDLIMQIPMLDTAQSSVWFYHAYLVQHEAKAGELSGLADRIDSMTLGYDQCVVEAREIILRAAGHP